MKSSELEKKHDPDGSTSILQQPSQEISPLQWLQSAGGSGPAPAALALCCSYTDCWLGWATLPRVRRPPSGANYFSVLRRGQKQER